ncbi:glycosyltransferase [Methylobacterium radiodurans]|uniref:Glycosyl transferase n=1 Tax=Methylobacterium radiodurans TaxID=2202828 RepID=A0A2U8VMJ6_9HYPH|nr:glycosyltransferase [Methylobacterium radiodurans]AWN34596.1 glycosyl transferase [Methylobacterium radiodurans]
MRAPPSAEPADVFLRFAEPRPARRLPALAALAQHPGRTLALLWARLTGRRLRARQGLAALVGIDHRLTLPPATLTAFPAAPEPFADPDILLLSAPGHVLKAGAAGAIRVAFADPGLHALYGDTLAQSRPGGPVVPLLRPAFDPDFLAAIDYIGPVVALRRAALGPAGINPRAGAADALFRVAEHFGPSAIGHLPGILALRQPRAAAGEGRGHAAAVRDHLDQTGRAGARIEPAGEGVIRIVYPLPEPRPAASLIVPTRDRLDLLRPCIESLLATDWPDLDLVVLDNDSREPETRAYLDALAAAGRARVLPWPGAFNFAAMNNAAAGIARGRLLVFVNNDVVAGDPAWLAAMARHALRPEIGAVGAKLIDGAGRIQHGGIVLGTGGGLVTHAHRHFPGEAPGYLGTLRVPHRVSAVTAACLMVEAEAFAAVGGFDADTFAVDFNDVDLCLRLNAAGRHTLMVPEAVLHHYEGLSRRRTPEAAARHAREIAAFKKRWGPLLAQDPHYHPGFDPDLSTHARLRPGALQGEPGPARRPLY